jgi:hypothetical protein
VHAAWADVNGAEMSRKVLPFVLILFASAAQADVRDVTVEGLFNQCKSNVPHEITFCVGYISAVLEAMQSVDASNDPRGFTICALRPLAYADGMKAFMTWAQRHPEHRGRDRWFGVSTAYRESWPCERDQLAK